MLRSRSSRTGSLLRKPGGGKSPCSSTPQARPASRVSILRTSAPAGTLLPVTPLPTQSPASTSASCRSSRALRREKVHGAAARAARAAHQSFLVVNTVNLGTAVGYDEHIRKFVEWAHLDAIESLSASLLEPLIIEYFESLYFEGANHDAGDRLMAALEYRDRRLRKGGECDMRKAREALRGFKRLAPGLSRAPLPYVALCGLIGAAASINRRDFGLALLIQFCGYFRPSELLGIVTDRLIPPQKFSGSGAWAVLLSPQEEAIGSKTHEFDESVLLDWEIFTSLKPLLDRLKERPWARASGTSPTRSTSSSSGRAPSCP